MINTIKYFVFCVMAISSYSGLAQRTNSGQVLPPSIKGEYKYKSGKVTTCTAQVGVSFQDRYSLNCECEKPRDKSWIHDYKYEDKGDGAPYNIYVCPQCSLTWYLPVDKNGKHRGKPYVPKTPPKDKKLPHKCGKECCTIVQSNDGYVITYKNTCKAGKYLYCVFLNQGKVINGGVGVLPSEFEVKIIIQDPQESIIITPVINPNPKWIEENLKEQLKGIPHNWDMVLSTIYL